MDFSWVKDAILAIGAIVGAGLGIFNFMQARSKGQIRIFPVRINEVMTTEVGLRAFEMIVELPNPDPASGRYKWSTLRVDEPAGFIIGTHSMITSADGTGYDLQYDKNDVANIDPVDRQFDPGMPYLRNTVTMLTPSATKTVLLTAEVRDNATGKSKRPRCHVTLPPAEAAAGT